MLEICDVQMLAFGNDGGLFGGHQSTAMADVQALAVSEVGCKRLKEDYVQSVLQMGSSHV